MLRSLPQAQEELADVAPLIEGAIRTALQRYTTEHAAQRRDYSRRSQASIIHDLMVAETRTALDGRKGVVCMTAKGTFVVIVRQTYIIKLKKLGYRLRTSNIPTQTSMAFINQQPLQLTLAQVPTETHLVFGYQPKAAELLSASIWVTCPMGSGMRWSWQLETEPVTPIVPLRAAEEAEPEGPLFGAKVDVQPGKKRDDDGGR